MLTFEVIRELERNEKSNRKLQKLPENIVDEIAKYLAKKESMAEKTSSDIAEMENVKSAIKRFYELREKKITEYALDTVRTGMPPQNMLPFEEHTFWQMVDLLKGQREMYFTALSKPITEGEEPASEQQISEKPIITDRIKESVHPEEKIQQIVEAATNPFVAVQKTYKIMKTLPPFVGLDLQIYELKEGDVREIPKPLNELLLKEGVIEEYIESK